MNPKALQELIDNLRVFYRCPSCSAEYRADDIRFLGKVEQHCFMQLNCKECSLPVLATVLLSHQNKQGGEAGSQHLRKQKKRASNKFGADLSRREKAAFHRRGAITASEIADFYSFLKTQK